MARKNNVKTEHPSSILFDSRTGTVMAGPDSNDNIKEKVQSVREVVLGKSNNEIVLVLQYYDYNVEKAIQAYLEDGAKEALGEWHVPPAKPNKKKKNKKKAANAGQTDNGPSASIGGAAAPAASLSSSLSSQPSLSSAQPLPQRVPAVSNGISSSGSSVTETNNNNSSSASKPLLSNGMVCSGSIKDVEASGLPAEDGTVVAATAAAAEVSVTTSSSHPPASASATKRHNLRVSAGSHGHGHGHGHAHGHNQRTRTTSERSTASGVGAGGDNHPKRPFQGLEKSIKDLQRQTTSLEHLGLVLDHEIERSYKSIKMVFEEMRTHLNTREKEIVSELDVVKQQAYEVFKMRQEKAATLKVHIERAEKMSESELGDLRADVKHFVADRKIDEELGKTTRFQYDSDHLKEEILSFGEVVPVKSNYVHRRPSVSSVASSGPGVEEVPPSSAASLHPEPAPVASLRAASSLETENAQMTTEELADLQIRLQNSLKLQGLVEDRRPSNGNDSSPSTKDDSQQTKSARRRNRNRERQEQRRHEEEVMVTSSPPGEASSRAATPSSTHASAGSASPSPQRGQRSSPQRGGGYRGRGRGGSYRGGQQQQGRGSPRRPYSASRGGGRGGGGDYGRQGGSRSVVVNGGYS